MEVTMPCLNDTLERPGNTKHVPQVAAVHGLIRRVVPDQADLFRLQLCSTCPGSHGFFAITANSSTLHIRGTSGVELASGFHWFLKHFAHCSVSWDLTGGVQVNSTQFTLEGLAAMEANGTVMVERAVPFSFYQNVVTMSYSMAFWDWDRWEAELDWMALQGINMPLMPLGMEALQVTTFTALGLQPNQLDDFFPGPAFLAWGRMGNIQGYAGPLPPAYMAKQLELAKRVVGRMRQLGMTPIYPAFAGFIPRALAELYPEAAVTPASNWCHFPPGYCCPMLLDPSDPLFAKVGATYISTLRAHLGWDTASYYIADSFNEMKPASDTAEYLSGVSASVFAGMTAADPNATWVMQAWLFFSDSRFWQPAQIMALLSGVPKGRLVLLDLFAEEHPIWSRTAGLYGHPFIWCMLHNFGGNLEMYGALPAVAEGLLAAMTAHPDNLIGVGMAPEGIEHNPAVYEFMAEMAYKGRAAAAASPGGLSEWFKGYAQRRYAAAGPLPSVAAAAVDGAWQLLARSVYSCRDKMHNTVADIPTSRPGLNGAEIVGWGLGPHLWYSVGDVVAAWGLLLQAAAAAPVLPGNSSAFVYDMLDVSRELMSKIAGRFWADAVEAYKAGNSAGLRASGLHLLNLLAAMDQLLGSHKGFMLGPAIARARAYALDSDCSSCGKAELVTGGADSRAMVSEAGSSVLVERSNAGSIADVQQTAAVGGLKASSEADSSRSSFDSDATVTLATGNNVNSGRIVYSHAQRQLQEQQQQRLQREQLAQFYEWNLRTQLTIWGTSSAAGDSEVSDYANKEWSGLVGTFYLPRWRAWLQRLETDLLLGRPYDAAAWRLEVLQMTYQWINTGSTVSTSSDDGDWGMDAREEFEQLLERYPVLPQQPVGDAVQLSTVMYEHYGRLLTPTKLAAMAPSPPAAANDGGSWAEAPAPASSTVMAAAAAAAAAVVVGAAGAAAAVVAATGAAPAAVPLVDRVIA